MVYSFEISAREDYFQVYVYTNHKDGKICRDFHFKTNLIVAKQCKKIVTRLLSRICVTNQFGNLQLD